MLLTFLSEIAGDSSIPAIFVSRFHLHYLLWNTIDPRGMNHVSRPNPNTSRPSRPAPKARAIARFLQAHVNQLSPILDTLPSPCACYYVLLVALQLLAQNKQPKQAKRDYKPLPAA
jgi:hypothetical protein